MKTAVLSFVVLGMLATKAFAQASDTVTLNDVTVLAVKRLDLKPNKLPALDAYKSKDLGGLLAAGGYVVRRYSPGGSATAAPRGYTAQQATVKWNGVDIANPMLAQTDLSLIPVFFFDAGRVDSDPNVSDNAPAGSVELVDSFRRGLRLSLYNGWSSLHNVTNALQFEAGATRWSGTLRLYNEQNKNSFLYRNAYLRSDTLTRLTHANGNGRGASIGVKYAVGTFALRLGGFAYRAARNLPPTMLEAAAKDNEADQNAVGFVRFERNARTALVADVSATAHTIRYHDGAAAVEYDSRSVVYRSSVSATRHVGVFAFNGKAQTALFAATVLPDVYKRSEWQHGLEAGVVGLFDRLRMQIDARGTQRFRERNALPFNHSLALTFVPTSWLQCKIMRSRVGRLPGLNDRYWKPGGNPDLKPELALHNGLTVSGTPHRSRRIVLQFACDAYYDRVDNWIQWEPNGAYWSPRNVKSVWLRGVEPMLNLKRVGEKTTAEMTLRYAYNKAVTASSFQPNDASVGKQLMYVPLHTAHARASLSTRHASVYAVCNSYDRRYTASDDTRQLDPYVTFDAGFSTTAPVRRFAVVFLGNVENAAGADYQTIEWRPMPRRTFSFSLILQYTADQQTHENNETHLTD